MIKAGSLKIAATGIVTFIFSYFILRLDKKGKEKKQISMTLK